MGLDVYEYLVIGVPAEGYIKEENKWVKIPETLHGKNVYDSDGNQLFHESKQDVFTYKGEDFSHTYEIGEKYFPEGNHYYVDNLQLYLFDGYYIHKQDAIGLLVCDNSQEGGYKENCTLEYLSERFELAEQLLLNIGITEEPKIMLVMRWSN